MAVESKMLPVGVENFEEIIKDGYYFVDKTGMIAELLRNLAKVNLFTRPRRFGKSLNMSMLKCFFEIGGNASLFDGLAISKETELCKKHMGRYPVINLVFKDAEGDNFVSASRDIAARVSVEAEKYGVLRASERLSAREKALFEKLTDEDMSLDTLGRSLWNLSRLLEKHYGQKVILLIDEYDVPLQKAFLGGYYDEMVGLIRGLFSRALKTNTSLKFAVLTGCLRISRESIFTGMNNLCVMTMSDEEFSGCFGFTDGEVRQILEYYDLEEHYGAIKDWYDGYRFASTDVYCPWDVLSYVKCLLSNPDAFPENFWSNSSGNDAVREFVRRMDTGSARQDLQRLADGGTVRKEIRQDITYRDMYSTIDNLWSLLYMTGYLTVRSRPSKHVYELALPNEEIRELFMDQIMELFRENTEKDGESLRELCLALAEGDAARVEKAISRYLRRLVSVRDSAARQGSKENFYHGLLLGILAYKEDWTVYSNYETGDGYGDILVKIEDWEGNQSLGIVIEVKYVLEGSLESGTREALKQIEDRHYVDRLYEEGMEKVLRYGIAFRKKQCRVALGE